MENKAKHTAIENEYDRILMNTTEEHLIKCVNNHDALLEACKSLIRSYEFHCPEAREHSNAIRLAKEAIARASK